MEKYVIFKGLPDFSGSNYKSDGRLNVVNGVPYLLVNNTYISENKLENSVQLADDTAIIIQNHSGNNRGVAFMDLESLDKYVTKEEHPEYFL